jgi:hypothetical protein
VAPGPSPFEADAPALAIHEPPALTSLCRSVQAGKPWAVALLTAVGEWTAPRELVDGEELSYLIGGEAFDWLLLAERLLRGLDAGLPGSVPVSAWEPLLFRGELPPTVTETFFKEALGVAKYRAYLNYHYGVVVEEALWHAVELEVEKERGVSGLQHPMGVQDIVMHRLYRADYAALMRRFRREQGRRPSAKLPLAEWKELTYWLFKRRVGSSDSSRTASDTRKGLRMLDQLRARAEGAGTV